MGVPIPYQAERNLGKGGAPKQTHTLSEKLLKNKYFLTPTIEEIKKKPLG